MNALNNLFRKTSGGISSGCIIIGGDESMGPEELFISLIEQACTDGRTLIVLDAKQDNKSRLDLTDRIRRHLSHGTNHEFSPAVESRGMFDVFSACATPIEKASLLADLLIIHSMNPSYRNDVATYFQYVIELKSTSRLNDILTIDPRSAIGMLSATDPSFEMKKIFIEDFRTRTYGNILAAISILAHSHESVLMSGDKSLSTILNSGNAIVVSDIPPVSGTVTNNGLFKSVFMALMSGISRYGITNGVVLLRHADFIATEDLEALMNITHSQNTLFVWLPENIKPFVDAGGGPVLQKTDYLGVFKSDRISAETWASMFGHRERVKVTVTNTSPKKLFGSLSFGSIATGGIRTVPFGRRGSRSVTTSKEDKQNVTADQISNLRYGRAWTLYPDGKISEGKID